MVRFFLMILAVIGVAGVAEAKTQKAILAGGWSDTNVIDFDAIIHAPLDAAMQAAAALDLGLDQTDIERNVDRLAGRYAKQPDASFSIERRSRADDAIMAEHRQVFDDALAWAETTLGPQRLVAAA